MAVPFYVPEGGNDDTSSSAGSSPSNGTNSASSQSPNTTSSATQTPAQSPLVPDEQLVRVLCEALYRVSGSNAPHGVHYSTPPSPSWSMYSPTYTGGEVFFPRGRSTPRTPRTSVSFAAGEEINFFRHNPSTSQNAQAPQSAPPMSSTSNQHQHQHQHQQYNQQPPHQHPHLQQQQQHQQLQHQQQHPQYQPTYHHLHTSVAYTQYQYTPPPTPTTSTIATATATSSSGYATTTANATSTTTATGARLHRSLSDAARRSRLTSNGEDERECHSEHETSWDEIDERFDNFTAGRERLQEFNGRIPPRKKKKDIPKSKTEKKEQSFTWPAVVTVFVVAMGCGYLVAR